MSAIKPPPSRGREIVIAHDQTAGVGHGGEPIHLPIVDLGLFLIEAVHQIAGRDVLRYVLVDPERGVRQLRWKSACRQLAAWHRCRWRAAGRAVELDLPRLGAVEALASGNSPKMLSKLRLSSKITKIWPILGPAAAGP